MWWWKDGGGREGGMEVGKRMEGSCLIGKRFGEG